MAFGADREVHTKHKFLLQTAMFGSAAFQKCSAVEWETARIDYFEGGALIPITTPGRITVTDVTCDRGSSNNWEFHDWCVEVADMSIDGGKGSVSPNFKKEDVAIQQLDLDNSVLREWGLVQPVGHLNSRA
jgi:hypothetical protein